MLRQRGRSMPYLALWIETPELMEPAGRTIRAPNPR
jgi:hypothetical protein